MNAGNGKNDNQNIFFFKKQRNKQTNKSQKMLTRCVYTEIFFEEL